ncbi:hypothetical protein SAMN04488518_1232 [Pseudovibrio ascidiaceicola]|uniref:Uncharacterized protein n=1 Tax=Pseudovibrio ascidiaceicola TaxID=285279 RepID=A0A1I4FW79_9HYPH|nr:hypothetical protein SAMN04488518_1232 [Pseudovibrio ascidiaceicola]
MEQGGDGFVVFDGQFVISADSAHVALLVIALRNLPSPDVDALNPVSWHLEGAGGWLAPEVKLGNG